MLACCLICWRSFWAILLDALRGVSSRGVGCRCGLSRMLDSLHREIGCWHANTSSSQVVVSGSASAGLLSGAVADWVVGDPRRWHPVAGFGAVATALERRWRGRRGRRAWPMSACPAGSLPAPYSTGWSTQPSACRARTLPARLSEPGHRRDARRQPVMGPSSAGSARSCSTEYGASGNPAAEPLVIHLSSRRAHAGLLERRAYPISKDVYAHTPPARQLGTG
jgi:hypothetical protein